MTDTSKEAAANQNALVKALKDFNREWANDDVLTYSPVPSAPGYTTGMAGVYMGEAADFIAALLSERDALRAQLQAARECLQATVRKANGDVEPAPAFHHPQVNDTSALKSTSAEGEG